MGSRYGVKIRKRYSEVKKLQNADYECPACGKKKLQREANSLWKCRSCGAKLAGGAFTPSTSVGVTAKKTLAGTNAPAAQ